jgi:hypothetical protein
MPYVDDLPSKSQIFDHWKDRLRDACGRFIDWGEPSCWGCGFHYGSKYDIKRSDAGWDEIFRCWENMPLQRCHIVLRSLEGTNDVSNLFLMCRECHDLAPNTNIPEIFFEWIRGQSSWRRESSKISAAFTSFGVEEPNENEIYELITSDAFKSWSSGKTGIHRPQSKYAPISSRMTPATIVGLLIHYRRTHGK